LAEIGDGSFANPLAFSPGFAEQDGGRRVTVRDAFDIHGNIYIIINIKCQDNYLHLHGYILQGTKKAIP
jgi:hypothetical protein